MRRLTTPLPTSIANSTVRGSDAGTGWRGTEKSERSGEGLEKWLRGSAKLAQLIR